jgi:exonuclease III
MVNIKSGIVFFRKIIDRISRCGDLNVSHQSIDLTNPKTNTKTAGFTKEERDDFSKILNDGFIDSCKTLLFSIIISN